MAFAAGDLPKTPEWALDPQFRFRSQILEALGTEPDPAVRVQLAGLLDREGDRQNQLARLGLEGGLTEFQGNLQLKVSDLDIRRADSTTIRSKVRWVSFSMVLEALRNFGNWAAAAALAILLAWWMVGLLRNRDYTGAGYLKELLLVLAGGALGWIGRGDALRKKDGRELATEDSARCAGRE